MFIKKNTHDRYDWLLVPSNKNEVSKTVYSAVRVIVFTSIFSANNHNLEALPQSSSSIGQYEAISTKSVTRQYAKRIVARVSVVIIIHCSRYSCPRVEMSCLPSN